MSDDGSEFDRARLLGKMEAGIDRQGVQVDRIEASLTLIEGTIESLGSKLSDMHTRLTAVEQASHVVRTRHQSLTSDAIEAAMDAANAKQSDSWRVAAYEANEPLVRVTTRQTKTIERQPWYVGAAVALAMFASTFASALIQSCHH